MHNYPPRRSKAAVRAEASVSAEPVLYAHDLGGGLHSEAVTFDEAMRMWVVAGRSGRVRPMQEIEADDARRALHE